MTKTYAIGDIHGRYDLLKKAIDMIEERNPVGGTVVFLGDYVDKGPESKKVIDVLMRGPDRPERWVWICLMGNHEDMIAEHYGGKFQREWEVQGGEDTLKSFGGEIGLEVIEWMRNLPKYHVDGKRLFVHAGVNPKLKIDEQDDALLWKRYRPKDMQSGYPGLHVVHGHDPVREVILLDGRTNIDLEAFSRGILAIAVFENEREGGPSQIWIVKET